MRKLINFFSENRFLILILFFAVALRFYGITQAPPSLNWDEISHGYNAYSILKTGKDEWGFTLPTIFRAYGDYKLPVYIYLTAISEALLGITPLAVRLVSVLAGISTIIFTYFMTKKLFGLKTAILASFLVCIEPWTLFLSRGAFEANLSLAFIVSGVYFFLRGIESSRYLIPSSLLIGLSLWSYNSARIFVPLFLLVLILIYKDRFINIFKKERKILLSSILIFALFITLMFYQLLNPIGQARYEKVAILDEGAIAKIVQDRNSSKLPPVLSRLIYNKATYFTSSFIGNWLSYFSPEFLFIKGGTQFQFSVPNNGLIYLVDIPFFLLGLIYLIKRRGKESFLILSWLLLSPIPGSLTRDAPHVLRAVTMLPMPMVISASGFIFFVKSFKNGKFMTVFLIVYLLLPLASLENYLNIYSNEYRKEYSWSWQYGYKEVVLYAKQNYSKYDKIIVTKKYGEPHEFFLFFLGWNPEKYRTDPNLIRFYQSDWYWVDRFDKFYFVNDWQIPKAGERFILESKTEVDCISTKCLLITSPGNYPGGWKKLETVNFLDGKPAFEIYEN